jgi:hypothetical protein
MSGTALRSITRRSSPNRRVTIHPGSIAAGVAAQSRAGIRLAALSYMPKSKQRSTWPSDDAVRELEGDEVTSDDGRKLQDSEHVGAMSPDADADQPMPRPSVSPGRPKPTKPDDR